MAQTQEIRYSDVSPLNTMEVCIPRGNLDVSKWGRYWIVYIHGGAWRDPKITASSFQKTQSLLLSSQFNTSDTPAIAGFVSLNYRLSPHPEHPNPTNDPSRTATHPDHINDILTALSVLQSRYSTFKDNYILVGHSCGATLALQVGMSRSAWKPSSTDISVAPPVAVVGIEGLYDLPALVEYHASQSAYRDFVTGAFGSDESTWGSVSPVNGKYEHSWPEGRVVLLAHSHEDELVEWEQVDLMAETLRTQGWSARDENSDEGVIAERRIFQVLTLKGKHHKVWESGIEVARAVERALQLVTEEVGEDV